MNVSSLAPIDFRKWRIMFFMCMKILLVLQVNLFIDFHGLLMKFLYWRYAVQQNLLQVLIICQHFDFLIGGSGFS